MPKKLDRCVKYVKAKGKSENSAYAICSDSTGIKKKKGGGWKQTKESNNLFVNLFNLIVEAQELEKVGNKSIRLQDQDTNEVIDLTDFIVANSDGGTQNITLYGVRANDSKSEPHKKAGNPMRLNGRTNFKYKSTGNPSPLGDAKQRYDNYDILTVMVTSVDGKTYPKGQIRNIKVNTINKIVMGGKTYNILK
jgi:hypothetical protein